MANGSRIEFDAVIHPHAVDHENKVQPPSSRVAGPAGFYATALWLRAAFANLHYDIHHVIADGDLVAVNSTMNGHHVAPIALYTDDGQVDTASRRPGSRSPQPNPTGCESKTARSSSTGRTATTWGRPNSSAGYRRRPPT